MVYLKFELLSLTRKEVGEWVNTDDVVVVMESDKGEAEVRTTASGVISEFKYKVGDDATVGSVMFVIDTAAQKPAGGAKATGEAPKKEAPKSEAPKEAPKQTAAPAKTPSAKPEATKEAPKKTAEPAPAKQ